MNLFDQTCVCAYGEHVCVSVYVSTCERSCVHVCASMCAHTRMLMYEKVRVLTNSDDRLLEKYAVINTITITIFTISITITL